ncbi:MAG TPA: hypothetical protein VLL28_13075 [Hyphomicrobiaceae bacterium]|nr:hypothetical protein [Hyphomicrobiaceae bacterium]
MRVLLRVASFAALLMMSACGTGSSFSLPGFPSLGGSENEASHEADACPTPEKCATQLRMLVTDPVRNWVGQPQSAEAYANGTRLFAYRALKKKLTCDELHRALVETETAGQSLQGARYEGARKLMTDVRRELGAERTKRCRKA